MADPATLGLGCCGSLCCLLATVAFVLGIARLLRKQPGPSTQDAAAAGAVAATAVMPTDTGLPQPEPASAPPPAPPHARGLVPGSEDQRTVLLPRQRKAKQEIEEDS